MPRLVVPTVFMTRPQKVSMSFVRDLRKVAGPFEPVICPAFEYVGTGADIPDFDIGVFTSKAGVQFAPDGAGRHAFCVGDATARAALHSGYVAVSADGGADNLVDLILSERPAGRLLHVRGETSVGDVSGRLKASGLRVEEVVVYRKQIGDLTVLGKALKAIKSDFIIPLFSAETVSILVHSGSDFSSFHAVAISTAVAEAATKLSPASITVSAAPTQAEMVAAVSRLIA